MHVKLIKAAQEMGVYRITTDNVPYEDSPGKQVADGYWDLNIYDVDYSVRFVPRIADNNTCNPRESY